MIGHLQLYDFYNIVITHTLKVFKATHFTETTLHKRW